MFTQIRAHLRDNPGKECFRLKVSPGTYFWFTAEEFAEYRRAHPAIAGELTLDLTDADVRTLNKNPNVVISTKGLLAQLFG